MIKLAGFSAKKYKNYSMIAPKNKKIGFKLKSLNKTKEDIERIEKVLPFLNMREAEIIRLRFGIGYKHSLTLDGIGRIFRITRERVRQIEAKAIHKMNLIKNIKDKQSKLKNKKVGEYMNKENRKKKKVIIKLKEILEFLIEEQKRVGYQNRIEYDEGKYQGWF